MSNFCSDTGGRRWSLVWVRLFSRAVGRKGRCRQISLVCVGRTHSIPATLFAPTHGCVLSPSTLLRLPAVLYGACPVWCAVPIFGYATKVQTWLGLCFVPSPAGAAQTPRSLMGALSLGAVCLLPSAVPASASARTSRVHAPCVYSWELASSCDTPGRCRPSRISGSPWLETGGLFAVW